MVTVSDHHFSGKSKNMDDTPALVLQSKNSILVENNVQIFNSSANT